MLQDDPKREIEKLELRYAEQLDALEEKFRSQIKVNNTPLLGKLNCFRCNKAYNRIYYRSTQSFMSCVDHISPIMVKIKVICCI